MADNARRSSYTIHIARNGSECLASIPELCMAAKGATPQEALAAALEAEMEALRTLKEMAAPIPPANGHIDPFPRITRAARRYWPFVARIAAGYVLVAFMTIALLAIAYPSVRLRAEQYWYGKSIAVDAGKVFARLGVALCQENR